MQPFYDHNGITIYQGDCLDIMPELPPQSIDAIICDPPYGSTACSWDQVIPFDDMWRNIKRLIRPRGAVVLFGSEPFSSHLRLSNIKWYKYDWVWNKRLAGNGIIAHIQPLKIHENVCVFADGVIEYYPQKTKGLARYKGGIIDKHGTFNGASSEKVWNDEYHPISILEFSGAAMRSNRKHGTQKPVALMQYLIRTYTNPGDTILDFTMGSGTTLEAAQCEGRRAIGIERDLDDKGNCLGYCQYAVERLSQQSIFSIGLSTPTPAVETLDTGQRSIFDLDTAA